MTPGVVAGIIVFAGIIILVNSVKIVPQKQAFIVERLGKYRVTLNAGFHLLVPFVDVVRYRVSLKEMVLDIPPQQCITRDNITEEIDGILYMQVMDPVKASYGIDNYLLACAQLAQTTLRSEIGKLEMDRTFEEREIINSNICRAVDEASDPWGVKITRYEIKSITPPGSVMDAMQKQMRAEREKRATISESEGVREAKINRAEGEKREAIALSEGEMQRRINEAQGKAEEIRLIAEATANGIAAVAHVLNSEAGAKDAMNLRLAEAYIAEFGKLAKQNNSMIIPADVASIASLVKVATSTFQQASKESQATDK